MNAAVAVVGVSARAADVAAGLAEAGFATTLIGADGDPGAAAPVDLVLFAVRPSDTDGAARRVRPLVGAGTLIVSLQEGIGGGGALAAAFGPERVVLAVTADGGVLWLGPHEGVSTDEAERCAAVLTAAGFEARTTPTIAAEIWRRLVVTAAAAPVAALLGADHVAPHGGSMEATMDEIALEVVRVARALGHDVDTAERLQQLRAAEVEGMDGVGEIDAINGAVVEAAAGVGVDVPLNRALLALVKERELIGAGRRDLALLRRLDHVAVAVLDTDAALQHFRDTLGLHVFAVDEPPEIPVRLTYLDLGNTYLQLVEPLDGESAIAAWLAENGEGLHHICFEVEDLPAALRRLRPAGTRQPALGSGRGRPTGFVAGTPPHGVRIEFTTPEERPSHD
jgi:methylmalonyl-CoA epimerase